MIKVNLSKILCFTVCLLPAASLIYNFLTYNLGAEPINKILDNTGLWTLRLLLITLSITTLRKLLNIKLMKYRRMLGLFVFFYATLHFLTYIIFEHSLSLVGILDDIVKKKYILVGFLAFLCLIPLAITSTKAWIKRLGKRWVNLHKLIYLISVLGILHFLWLVKSDISEPIIYGLILASILGLRRFKVRYKKVSQQNTNFQ